MERALNEQISWIEGINHANLCTPFEALNQLALQIDTPPPSLQTDHPQPILLFAWNPHLHDYSGPLELEAALDYRPVWSYDKRPHELPLELRDAEGRVIPFQVIESEHHFMRQLPWRKRIVIDTTIPASGWTTYTLGWVEDAVTKHPPGEGASAPKPGLITNMSG